MKTTKTTSQAARIATPWLSDTVIYQMYLRAFTPEGTLQAATEKLAEVAAVGVDIIYLCPICLADDDEREAFWSDRQKASGCKNPKNPYRIKDYFAVDPEYGSDDDLHAFVAQAHRLGLKVMLDIVYLHCGPQAVFLDEHPDFVDRDENGDIKPGPWHFPMLNFDNQELREYLWDNLEYWVRDFDVDGYRCDVSGKIPLDFWEEARRRVSTINPDFVWLAEAHRTNDQSFAFDLSYSFDQNSALYELMRGEKTAADFRKRWEEIEAKWLKGSRFLRYTDNHDLANDNRERIENQWGADAMKATLTLIFALDGVPMLYNGQEVADGDKHSIYAQWPVNWANATTEVGQERLALCRKLCALRHGYPELCRGDVQWLDNTCPEQVLTFKRTYQGKSLMAAINLSDKEAEIALEAGLPILSSGVKLADGTATLAPFATYIGK